MLGTVAGTLALTLGTRLPSIGAGANGACLPSATGRALSTTVSAVTCPISKICDQR